MVAIILGIWVWLYLGWLLSGVVDTPVIREIGLLEPRNVGILYSRYLGYRNLGLLIPRFVDTSVR